MEHKTFKPGGLATAIGSMPHVDPLEACSIVLANLKEIPVWPQLPNRSPLEEMYAQFSEGFPGAALKNDQVYVDRSGDLSAPLEELYSAYLSNDLDSYAISPKHAAGLHEFLRLKPKPGFAVKGQVTGPITFGLATTDQNRQPILYDETLADALAKHLRLKAAWQERELAKLSPHTIIFVDEPYLVSLGSAFVALSENTVITLIDEVLDGISGLKGIHCCGNTDWSTVMKTSIDILNFDAYAYGESLALYPGDLKAFLDRGGILAWGIVPSDEKSLSGETAPRLAERLQKLMRSLAAKGIRYDILVEQCLITPSCGLATLSAEAASRALELTSEVSREFRHSHGLI
ncbi:MAG: methionine synthase [Dehalococcoidia bacterium]|nr:methionine synthase [Dehalococcoidia bacterium]